MPRPDSCPIVTPCSPTTMRSRNGTRRSATGVVHATGLDNGLSSAELLDAYRAEQRAASERLKATAIADLPSIAAWRRAFTRFGAKPTQYRSAVEALLRRLAEHGDIPTISTRGT